MDNILALPPQFELNHYVIESVLGQGGFGVVYQARNPLLNEIVAIKEFLPAELASRSGHTVVPHDTSKREIFDDCLQRFIQEGRVLIRLQHHNVVRCRDLFMANGTAYLVMGFEDGMPLDELVKSLEVDGQRFSEQQMLHFLIPLLDGLAYIHSQGVLHRDIKPGNVFIRRIDNTPVLIDFGAAKQNFAEVSQSRAPYTEFYAPIEQIEGTGEAKRTLDIHAVGGLMYRIVCGHIGAKAEKRALQLVQTQQDALVPASSLAAGHYSESFLRLIDWCLSFNAEDRPQTAEEVRDALIAIQQGQLVNIPQPQLNYAQQAPLNTASSTAATMVNQKSPAVDPYAATRVSQPSGPAHTQAEGPATTQYASVAGGNPAQVGQDATVISTPQPAEKKNNNGLILSLLMIVLLAGLGGGIWYFLEEQKRIEQEAILAQQEESKKQQEAAEAKAEAAAKKQAEEEAKAKAEQERLAKEKAEKKRKAEEAAKKKAEEEARKKAEAQAAKKKQEELRKQLVGTFVKVPEGSFRMGSDSRSADPDEKPVHKVYLKSFYMQEHEVTWDQYMHCVNAGACRRPDHANRGMGDHPVVNVSWNEVQTYLKWLNRQGVGEYRLPSEAEWEYAALAGSDAKYSWGNRVYCSYAWYGQSNNECGNGTQTRSVKSYEPNRWGLYDMHGNVFEWVQDCWNGSYNGAPKDGSAWLTGDCGQRVLRGGSIISAAEFIRAANRYRNSTDANLDASGFRLVRTTKD